MATINYTDTAFKIQQALTGSDTVKLPGNLCCGNILIARGQYTVSGAAVGDEIKITRLPKGAVVIPHLCQVFTEALGTSFAIAIGDSEANDRYAENVSLSTAGRQELTGGSSELSPEPLATTDWITATITEVTAPSTGKKAQFWIAYVMP